MAEDTLRLDFTVNICFSQLVLACLWVTSSVRFIVHMRIPLSHIFEGLTSLLGPCDNAPCGQLCTGAVLSLLHLCSAKHSLSG